MKLPFRIRIEGLTAPEATPQEAEPLDPEAIKVMDKQALKNLLNQLVRDLDAGGDEEKLRLIKTNLGLVEEALRVRKSKRRGFTGADRRDAKVVAEARAALSPTQPVRVGWPWLKLWHLWLVLIVLALLVSAGATPGTYLVIIVPYVIVLWAVHGRRKPPRQAAVATNEGGGVEATPPPLQERLPRPLGCLWWCFSVILRWGGLLVLLLFFCSFVTALSQQSGAATLIFLLMALAGGSVWRYRSIPVPPATRRGLIRLPKAELKYLCWPPGGPFSEYNMTTYIEYDPDEFVIRVFRGFGALDWPGFDTRVDEIVLGREQNFEADWAYDVLTGIMTVTVVTAGGAKNSFQVCGRKQLHRTLRFGKMVRSCRLTDMLRKDRSRE